MTTKIKQILEKLDINKTGTYDNHFYIIKLDNSNEYSKVYTKLCDNAVNQEYPYFDTNTSKSTIKVTNYFEFELDNIIYNIFLIGNFDTEEYYLKIGEK